MQVEIDSVPLSVQIEGEGSPTLVFLHYWGGTHRTWSGVVDRLKSSFQCVTYDMRGWGKSGPASTGYSISALAAEAASLIERLGLCSYVLVGHSMGGKVAQLLASYQPVGLRGLVLVAPATPSLSQMPEAAKQQQLHAYDDRGTILQTIGFLTARPPSPQLIEQIIEDSLSGAPEAKLAWPTEGMSADISPAVSHIAVPTLILAGELDRLDSIEQHRREVLPRISGATLEIITGSGHLLPIDAPAPTAAAIEKFVASFQVNRKDSR